MKNKKVSVPGMILISVFMFSCVCAAQEFNTGWLPALKSQKLVQVSSRDATGGNNDYLPMKPRETVAILDVKGAGRVCRLWLTVAVVLNPFYLRDIVIRMYWDGEKTPSVEAPIGDFFGTGFGKYVHHYSAMLGTTSGGFYTYFPMPFERGARIEITNESRAPVQALYYNIEYYKLDKLPKDTPRFHAKFRREKVPAGDGKNYLVLHAKGKGFYAGTVLSMKGTKQNIEFLEGDEMVYVDGEKEPSLYGTGTEDYFNSGWYYNHGAFYSPFHGLNIKDEKAGLISTYRFHILDAIPFQKEIKFTIEHGTENKEAGDYSSVAYWYQTEPHYDFEAFPKALQRRP